MAYSKKRIVVGVLAVAVLALAGVIVAKKMQGWGSQEAMPPEIDASVATDRLQGMVAELANRMAVTQECTLGERADLTLSIGQAATLQYADNDIGLQEVLLGTQGSALTELFRWEDGELSGGIRDLPQGWSVRGLSEGGFWIAVWNVDEKNQQVQLMALAGNDQSVWDGYVAIQQRRLRGEGLQQALQEFMEGL